MQTKDSRTPCPPSASMHLARSLVGTAYDRLCRMDRPCHRLCPPYKRALCYWLPYCSLRRSRRRSVSRSVTTNSVAFSPLARCVIQLPCGRLKMSFGPQLSVSSPTRVVPLPSTTQQTALLVVR